MNGRETAKRDDEDWLEGLLRADAHEHESDYLSDDGFTARVLSVLPAVAVAPAWRRPVIALLWTVVAIASLVALPGIVDDIFRAVAGLVFGHRLSFAEIAAAITLLGATTWAGLVYAARAD